MILKGKLNEDGQLFVWRKDQAEQQRCMYSGGACGHTCPQFGEPRKLAPFWSLDICHGKALLFEGFKDGRPGHKENNH